MSGKIRLLLSLLSLAAALFTHEIVAQESAPRWQIVPEKSFIKFKANYANAPVLGEFAHFTADIRFSPQLLKVSSVVVRVDLTSVRADDDSVTRELGSSDWFDTVKHKEAVFESKEFVHIKDNYYEARGLLTLRDKKLPVVVNFTLVQFDKTLARAEGTASLERTKFGIGQGEWRKTDVIADKVIISVAVEAKPL